MSRVQCIIFSCMCVCRTSLKVTVSTKFKRRERSNNHPRATPRPRHPRHSLVSPTRPPKNPRFFRFVPCSSLERECAFAWKLLVTSMPARGANALIDSAFFSPQKENVRATRAAPPPSPGQVESKFVCVCPCPVRISQCTCVMSVYLLVWVFAYC